MAPRTKPSLAPADTEQIRAMKRRIERERASGPGRDWNLKLGPGGLSDIEFLVQYLQLRHGGSDPSLREVSTLGAVRALSAAGHLTPDETQCLIAGHDFLTRLRQSLYLLRSEAASDVLPLSKGDERTGQALAGTMACGDIGELQEAYRAHTTPVRELFLRYVG